MSCFMVFSFAWFVVWWRVSGGLTSRTQARGTKGREPRSGTGTAITRCLQRFVRPHIHLNRRFRTAEAFTIEPRPIEAARASLPGSEHRAGIVDPARASLWLLGGGDPLDPIRAPE